MKKTTRILLIALMLLSVISVTSCTATPPEQTSTKEAPFVPKDAVSLWNKIDETMNALKSYEGKSVMDTTYYLMGDEYQMTSEATLVLSDGEDGFFEYNHGKNVIGCEANALNETVENLSAYYNGKMYLSTVGSAFSQKLCSPMTVDEFREETGEGLSGDVDFSSAKSAEFEKKDDGSWSIRFYDYTKKNVNEIVDSFGVDESSFGEEILDVEIFVLADADFRATKITIQLVFDVDDSTTTKPSLHVDIEYFNFNSARSSEGLIKTEEYTEVADVRVISDVADGLDKIKDATKGEFVLELSETYDMFGEKTTSLEKDTVKYGVENGAYYFDLTSVVDGEEAKISYRGGTYTVIQGGSTQTSSITDDSARLVVNNLIDNSSSYVTYGVTDVKKESDGVYLLKITHKDISAYKESMKDSGIDLKSVTQEVKVTFTDGDLTRLENAMTLSGEYSYGYSTENVKITLNADFSFVSVSEDKVSA